MDISPEFLFTAKRYLQQAPGGYRPMVFRITRGQDVAKQTWTDFVVYGNTWCRKNDASINGNRSSTAYVPPKEHSSGLHLLRLQKATGAEPGHSVC